MPDDFHPEFQIDRDGRIVPAGRMELVAGWEVTKIYAWVVQQNSDGTSAMCSGFQDDFLPDSDSWVARADAYHAGQFHLGEADATAVTIRRSTSLAENHKVNKWSQTVFLTAQQ